MKMESGNARTTRSVWESRMKNEQVQGGVRKGRNDDGGKPRTPKKNVVDVITDAGVSESDLSQVPKDSDPKSGCVSPNCSSKVRGGGLGSPSMGLKKTRSEPPLDKMGINKTSPLLRKMKSEPTRAAVASSANKKVCGRSSSSCSDSQKDEEEDVVAVECTETSQSSTQIARTTMEFNPLGIPKSGIQETYQNSDHNPDAGQKQAADDKLDLMKAVDDGAHHDHDHGLDIDDVVGNSTVVGEKENINNKNEDEIKVASVVTANRSKPPQVINRPNSVITSNGVRKSFPSPKKPVPIPSKPVNNSSNRKEPTRKPSDDVCTTPECDGRFQSLVDLVMWRDVSRSAFVFGIGSFLIISSSYAKDLNISVISGASYVGLVYLAITFMYRSIICRGMVDEEDSNKLAIIIGEEEAVWMVKLILPYINELLSKMRRLFSGDPGLTIKMGLILFVLARCGTSITIRQLIQLGFFGVFVIPKLCSSYSTHIIAYGKFWVERIGDAWRSCTQKKLVGIGIFTLVWNCCSTVARAWAVFMLYVAVRYYHQSLNDACDTTTGHVEEEDGRTYLHQTHKQQNVGYQNKEKKSL